MGAADKRLDIPVDWTFRNADVAKQFDKHVREQLPWYDMVSGAAAHFARHYIPHGGLVYDIGASTGNFGRAIEGSLKARNAALIAIEQSPEMAKMWSGPGQLLVEDALTYAFDEFDVAICFLVVMFFPPDKRRKWLMDLIGKCRHGGAVILVDKVVNPGGYFGTALHRLTMAGKLATGTKAEDIIAKEMSLPGAQRPLPPGFVDFAVPGGAQQFFRFGEFAGWVIESPRCA